MVGEWSGDLALWSAVGSASFLCSIGLGVFLSERKACQDIPNAVFPLEVFHALMGPLLVFILYAWHMIYRIHIYDQGVLVSIGEEPQVWIFGVGAQFLLFGLGLLSGYEFGLMSQLALQSQVKQLQRLMAIYHFGGLVASISFLCLLAPQFEPCDLALLCGLLHNVLAGLWQLGVQKPRIVPSFLRLGLGFLCLGSLFYSQWSLQLPQLHLKNFYYNRFTFEMDGDTRLRFFHPLGLLDFIAKSDDLPEIQHYRGLYQTIDFVPDLDVDVHGRDISHHPQDIAEGPPEPRRAFPSWAMYMDGHFQIHSSLERAYHETMTHLPIALNQKLPARALIIGGGDGLIARELLRVADYTQEKIEIDLIDIDSLILQLAREEPRLVALNKRSLHDPRVQVIVGDAFQTLRGSKAKYDAIYMDVLFPYNIESSRLYSREFFANLSRVLQADGFVSVLSPVDFDNHRFPEQRSLLEKLTSTMMAADFEQFVLYGEKRHSFLMIRKQTRDLLEASALEQSLAAALLTDPSSLERVEELSLEQREDFVNSLLKPRFFGMKDPFF
jgi:spermidine synthase